MPNVYSMPSICDSADIIVILMEDGLLPEEPWEGMTSYQREEFWSLGCSGMMIHRSAWSGYVIICPLGTGDEILETAVSLASAEGTRDNSSLASGLRLEPVSDCPSTVLQFSISGIDQAPSDLPLRYSEWLGGEPDTVMLTSDTEGNSFFWTGHDKEVDLSPAAWRGTGSELVPTGEGSVELAYTCVHGSVPSNLLSISLEPHEIDDIFAATWGAALGAVDSIIAGIHPLREDADHLLWIRGQGTGRPWRTAPSPTPPPSASYRVLVDLQPTVPSPLNAFSASAIPNALEVTLPGRFTDYSSGPVLEAVLDRMIGRNVHSDTGSGLNYEVRCGMDGSVSLWLVTADGESPDEECVSGVISALRNSLLVPPGNILIDNAVTRASFLEGRRQDSLGVREVSMELMNILYPQQE
jgi:hypothetical protein